MAVDKKSMTDDGMPPGSLSLRSYHLLHENNTFEFIFYTGMGFFH